ncbi:alpha,alpha-phosphotrehalase [Enterococcus pallens]|uniref:Alpha,alpha-phosphotrehalase n=1 Tax=Enterococcus pallens ATCC BAA-351 TaxID=1158607 RepID=R2SJU9_9ENTE|nr:alpha,alpha-phosphotrehalase [Enterococcus pallens]EOH93191.1 alpha,alpha-phosphotrehalase [Enterococcus pallens ATCC BAA-351]EOU24977.1 alpha,alpha-phosphotrehalase [Enterococcus pallens ATCC BAA-351]
MSFKDKVIYQIYPKSYLDTDGDGIGDLAGIIKKLPYLKLLGVDMIWLNPVYPSPQKDNGYDISDYTAINPLFGTMEEFQLLIERAKEQGITVMLDMVLNHVSIEHEWFQKALAGDKKYQDYFILRDEPTDWVSKFGGNAWAPFGNTGKYYLHLFDVTQADLNWRNPEVREELFKVVRFWMDKGIKGFRFDVINLIGKDEVLKNNAINDGKPEYTDRPIAHEYLRMLNEATYGKDPEIITVGEMSFTTVENCILYTQPQRHELSMTFNFHHLKVDYENGKKWTDVPFDFSELKRLFHTWGTQMSENNGWNAWFWNNHDQPRALNRFVDVENYRIEGAKMLATAIHLNRGTPYIYMGEEIGMVDPDFESMADYVDVESLNAYQELIQQGYSEDAAFTIVRRKSRDNARTPMQWTHEKNAGFTKGTPWLAVGNHAQEINAAKELEEGSIFAYYQQLIRLRKKYPVISEGSYQAFVPEHESVYGFVREYDNHKLLVLNNFFGSAAEVQLPLDYVSGEILIDNYRGTQLTEHLQLQPYQALAILI